MKDLCVKACWRSSLLWISGRGGGQEEDDEESEAVTAADDEVDAEVELLEVLGSSFLSGPGGLFPFAGKVSFGFPEFPRDSFAFSMYSSNHGRSPVSNIVRTAVKKFAFSSPRHFSMLTLGAAKMSSAKAEPKASNFWEISGAGILCGED